MGKILRWVVLGDKPYYMHLKACVSRLWKPTCSLDIPSRENGYFFFRSGLKMNETIFFKHGMAF